MTSIVKTPFRGLILCVLLITPDVSSVITAIYTLSKSYTFHICLFLKEPLTTKNRKIKKSSKHTSSLYIWIYSHPYLVFVFRTVATIIYLYDGRNLILSNAITWAILNYQQCNYDFLVPLGSYIVQMWLCWVLFVI